MCSIYVDPDRLPDRTAFNAEVDGFLDWVKASPPAAPGGEVLLPGDVERRTRAERRERGIPLDDTTIGEITEAAVSVGVARADVERRFAAARMAIRRNSRPPTSRLRLTSDAHESQGRPRGGKARRAPAARQAAHDQPLTAARRALTLGGVVSRRGAPWWAESTPVEPDLGHTSEGSRYGRPGPLLQVH